MTNDEQGMVGAYHGGRLPPNPIRHSSLVIRHSEVDRACHRPLYSSLPGCGAQGTVATMVAARRYSHPAVVMQGNTRGSDATTLTPGPDTDRRAVRRCSLARTRRAGVAAAAGALGAAALWRDYRLRGRPLGLQLHLPRRPRR